MARFVQLIDRKQQLTIFSKKLQHNCFQMSKECGYESFIIPSSLFGITKPFRSIEIAYCKLNEIKSKYFLNKFHQFIYNSFRIVIT